MTLVCLIILKTRDAGAAWENADANKRPQLRSAQPDFDSSENVVTHRQQLTPHSGWGEVTPGFLGEQDNLSCREAILRRSRPGAERARGIYFQEIALQPGKTKTALGGMSWIAPIAGLRELAGGSPDCEKENRQPLRC